MQIAFSSKTIIQKSLGFATFLKKSIENSCLKKYFFSKVTSSWWLRAIDSYLVNGRSFEIVFFRKLLS